MAIGEYDAAQDPSSETRMKRATEILVVAQAGIAYIVISSVAQTWGYIDPVKQSAAIYLIYTCGAHFAFCFAVVGPTAYLYPRVRSEFTRISLIVSLFSYLFWALLIQHSGLANVLLKSPWNEPMPGFDYTFRAISRVLDDATSVFLPLVSSYLIFGVLVTGQFVCEKTSGMLRKYTRLR